MSGLRPKLRASAASVRLQSVHSPHSGRLLSYKCALHFICHPPSKHNPLFPSHKSVLASRWERKEASPPVPKECRHDDPRTARCFRNEEMRIFISRFLQMLQLFNHSDPFRNHSGSRHANQQILFILIYMRTREGYFSLKVLWKHPLFIDFLP